MALEYNEDKTKVRNPDSGRMVLVNGAVGKAVLKKYGNNKKEEEKPMKSPEKKIMIKEEYKDFQKFIDEIDVKKIDELNKINKEIKKEYENEDRFYDWDDMDLNGVYAIFDGDGIGEGDDSLFSSKKKAISFIKNPLIILLRVLSRKIYDETYDDDEDDDDEGMTDELNEKENAITRAYPNVLKLATLVSMSINDPTTKKVIDFIRKYGAVEDASGIKLEENLKYKFKFEKKGGKIKLMVAF